MQASLRLIKKQENFGYMAMSKQFSALTILLNAAVVATVVKHAATTAHVVIIVAIKPVPYFDSIKQTTWINCQNIMLYAAYIINTRVPQNPNSSSSLFECSDCSDHLLHHLSIEYFDSKYF